MASRMPASSTARSGSSHSGGCSPAASLMSLAVSLTAAAIFSRSSGSWVAKRRLSTMAVSSMMGRPSKQARGESQATLGREVERACSESTSHRLAWKKSRSRHAHRIFASGSSDLMPSSSGILSFSAVKPAPAMTRASSFFISATTEAYLGLAIRLCRSSGSNSML